MFKILIVLFVLLFKIAAKEPDSLLISAYVNYDKCNYAQAIEDLSMLLNDEPNNKFYLQLRAESYFNNNNFEQSKNDFLKLKQLRYELSDYYLAKISAIQSENKNAANYLQEYLKLKNKIKESDIKIDDSFHDFQNTNEWKNIWKEDWYSKTDQLLMEVTYLSDYKRYEEALDLINEKIDKGTKNHKVFAAKGDVYFKMQEYNLALEEYNQAIKSRKNTDYFIKRAEIQNKLGNFSKSIKDYEEVLKREPYKVKLYKEIAGNYFENNQVESAIANMDKYLQYYPEDNEALYNFAQILFKNENYLSALKCYNKLIKYNSNNYIYYIGRGLTFLKTSTYEFAENDFSMALDLNPNVAKTYVNRGLARHKRGDLKGACKDWEWAKKLGEPLGIIYLQQYCE